MCIAPRGEAAGDVQAGFARVVVVDLGGEELQHALGSLGPRREQGGRRRIRSVLYGRRSENLVGALGREASLLKCYKGRYHTGRQGPSFQETRSVREKSGSIVWRMTCYTGNDGVTQARIGNVATSCYFMIHEIG